MAPPEARRARMAEWKRAAKLAGIRPYRWQARAAQTIQATSRRRWLYREVAVVVARQNGKSELLVPLIISRLLTGSRVMHTAQNRSLPREIFTRIANVLEEHAPAAIESIRLANGQESITLTDGGLYRIVAPTRGGARGPSSDLVIIDELREMDTWDFIAAAKPTLTASKDPQMLYLSNAGDESSVVLNALRRRAGDDPGLGYLEWSAHPARDTDDRDGWAEANPRSHERPEHLEYLAGEYHAAKLEGTLSRFETEHLCRWVTSLLPRIVGELAWARGAAEVEAPKRPALGVAMDPGSGRASAVLAWEQTDGTIAAASVAEVPRDVDVDDLGRRLARMVLELRIQSIGYGPATDRDLARWLDGAVAVSGQTWAAACDRFARVVEGGRIRHERAEAVSLDLAFTAKRDLSSGGWHAVRAKDDRSITAAEAAIRAIWLATAPELAAPTVY